MQKIKLLIVHLFNIIIISYLKLCESQIVNIIVKLNEIKEQKNNPQPNSRTSLYIRFFFLSNIISSKPRTNVITNISMIKLKRSSNFSSTIKKNCGRTAYISIDIFTQLSFVII